MAARIPDAPSKVLSKSVVAGDLSDAQGGVLRLIVPMANWYYGEDRVQLPPQLPLYWSEARDAVLHSTIHHEAMWAGAVGIALSKVSSLAWEVSSEVRRRLKRYQDIFLLAEGMKGWVTFLSKHLRDFLTTDNGAFVAIIRDGKKWSAPIVSLKHLDSRRCVRTGDPDRPVLYYDLQGRYHELKFWEVMVFSDMPDPTDTLYDVGFCAASRAYSAVYKLATIEWYYREKVGGLHPLAIHIVNGILDRQISGAVDAAKEGTYSRGVVGYMGAVVIGVPSQTAPSLVTIPLAELPDNFDRKQEFDLAVLAYANAIGLDVQDLQPLSGRPLGSGAQSQVLADKAKAKGLVAWRQQWTHNVNQWILPPRTVFAFMEKDWRDLQLAGNLNKTMSDASGTRIQAGITTTEQELQVLVDADQLPREFLDKDVTEGEKLEDTEKPEGGKGRMEDGGDGEGQDGEERMERKKEMDREWLAAARGLYATVATEVSKELQGGDSSRMNTDEHGFFMGVDDAEGD